MGDIAKTVLTVGSIAAAPFTAGTSLAWLPAAAGAGAALMGGFDSAAQQRQAGAAAETAQGNEQNALAGEAGLAQQIATGPDLQSLIDAQGSNIATLKSNIGGVANPGALYKDLSGQNIENALKSSIETRSSNLSSAANILGGTVSPYNTIGQQAQTAAGAGGNPFQPFMSALGALSPYLGKGTNTATGRGSGGDPSTPQGPKTNYPVLA